MKIKSIPFATVAVLVGALVSGAVISAPASATSSTLSVKEKAAITAYSKSMARARANYLAAVKPSQHAVLVVGRAAEAARRAKVKAALAAFNSVVVRAKAPSLADEKAYRAAVAKLAANPGDTSLKVSVKLSLSKLTQATAALKVDTRVAAARTAFTKARVSAMAAFKARLARFVKARAQARIRAMAQFKTAKAKAVANLKVAIKAARAN